MDDPIKKFHLVTSNIFSFQGMATVVAEEDVGQLPMARGTMTDGTEVVKAIVGTTSTTIPVGKNLLPVTAGMTEGVRAQAVTAEAAAVTTDVTMGAPPARMTGLYPYPGMTGSSRSYSRAATDHRASTLIGMRTFRSRPQAPTCPTVLKM